MRFLDIIRSKLGMNEREAEGTIHDLRIVTGEDSREEWLFRLDGHDAEFCFHPSPISRPRRAGDRVRVGYDVDPRVPDRYRAHRVAAA
jgi:hypothetical protein